MSSTRELPNLIASVYDAGLEGERWPDVLEQIACFLGTTVMQLWVGDPAQKARSAAWAGADPWFVRSYEEHFAELDPVSPIARTCTPGTILNDAMVMPRTRFEQSEIYQDWGRPQEVLGVMVANFLREGTIVGLLATSRRPYDENFERTLRDSLTTLLPHLQRAMRINLRLCGLSAKQHAASEALSALSHAILLVDVNCRVMFANRAAEEILALADGIGAGPRGLFAGTGTLTKQLHGLVGRAIRVGAGTPIGGVIALDRPSMKRPLQVFISPLGADTTWADSVSQRPAAMVLVVDPERSPSGSLEQLMTLYHLTHTEARVAWAIGRGEPLNAVAESFGVLPSTVRTHLHHVFAKTETQRQAELVRLIEQMALVRPDSGIQDSDENVR